MTRKRQNFFSKKRDKKSNLLKITRTSTSYDKKTVEVIQQLE